MSNWLMDEVKRCALVLLDPQNEHEATGHQTEGSCVEQTNTVMVVVFVIAQETQTVEVNADS